MAKDGRIRKTSIFGPADQLDGDRSALRYDLAAIIVRPPVPTVRAVRRRSFDLNQKLVAAKDQMDVLLAGLATFGSNDGREMAGRL